MFMAERRAYYDRREQAKSSPHDFHSTIADGMAQQHNKVPHYGSNHDAGKEYVKTYFQVQTNIVVPCLMSSSHL